MMEKLEFISISSVRSRKRPFSYRSRINPVLIPYRSRIVPASGSGNNTETIRKRYNLEGRRIHGGYLENRWRKGSHD